MKFLKLIKNSCIALSIEDELELCYFFGKNLKKINYMKLKKPWYSGLFFQILVFFLKLLRNFSFFSSKIQHRPILIYSGTRNQLLSVESILKSLRKNNLKFNHIVYKNICGKNINNNNINLKFSLKIFFISIILFLMRVSSLYLKLKKKKHSTLIPWHFNLFCESYIYIPYFIDLLSKTKTKLIIVSNDHNLDCRCLRLAAQILSIKTMYTQHAAISEYFPSLEYDYALLDGVASYKIYEDCFKNKTSNRRVKKNIAKCNVLLIGQKKKN